LRAVGPALISAALQLRRQQRMFFHSWADIGRVAVTSAAIFLIVVALLRIVGQRTLAKMSGFDVIFTVTLGSLVATVALTSDISVSEGFTALVVMLALQEGLRWLQARYLIMHHAVREPPRVLVWNGQLLEDRLRDVSVSADEIRAAVRKAGHRSISEVQVVVLENDGDWSVIAKSDQPSDESAFYGLPIPGRPHNSPADRAEQAQPTSARRLP
jgi:uncharacterized membrane protein YcaP (DUF421 family)